MTLLARGAHREQRLAVDLEAVDAVLGLDVDHLAARLAQHALDRRGDHPVTVWIAKDHHATPDVRAGDQVAGVETSAGSVRPLTSQLANLACSDADHGVARYSLRDGRRRVISFAGRAG